jgi:hypothetical protein
MNVSITEDIWKLSIPSKIKIFLWKFFESYLLYNDQIQKGNGLSCVKYSLCGLPTNMNHILF